jgi:acylphosphatase
MKTGIKRIDVVVSGEVQAVGYRELVRKAAFKKEITGFVQNLDDGDIKIVAEGSEEELRVFLETINISEYPIDIRNIDVRWVMHLKNLLNL